MVTETPAGTVIKAAELRAQRVTFAEIGRRFGLSPADAKKCVDRVYSLIGSEDAPELRARLEKQLAMAQLALTASMTAEQLRARAAQLSREAAAMESEAARRDEADDGDP